MSADRLDTCGVIYGVGLSEAPSAPAFPTSSQPQWIVVNPQAVPRAVLALVWLWRPVADVAAMQDEVKKVGVCVNRLIRKRGNALVPILFVAVDQSQWEHDSQLRQIGASWLKSAQRELQRVYHNRLRSLIPQTLTDLSHISCSVDHETDRDTVAQRSDRLVQDVQRFRDRLRQRSWGYLKLGLGVTVLYALVLLMTIPWFGPQKKRYIARNPMGWTAVDWTSQLADCQKVLAKLVGRSWQDVSTEELGELGHHLQWLPISYDLVSQKQASKQQVRLKTTLEAALGECDALIKNWIKQVPGSAESIKAQQARLEALMEGVFDPRRGPTPLQQIGQLYWERERQLTLQQIVEQNQIASLQTNRLDQVRNLLQRASQESDASRIHAPSEKLAWLQELDQALAWCATRLQSGQDWPGDWTDTSIPKLLREAMGKKDGTKVQAIEPR